MRSASRGTPGNPAEGPSVDEVGLQPSLVELRFPHLVDAIQRAADRGVEFYVVSNARIKAQLNMNPFGYHLRWLDFTLQGDERWSRREFLNMFNAMNGIAFGLRGLPMPNWVMVDLAMMPSAIVAAAVPQSTFMALLENTVQGEVQDHMIAVLEGACHRKYDGPVPIGGYCAAPSAVPGRWVGWSLWSVVPTVGLGLAAKSLALAVYRAKQLDGVTQYDNAALRIHTQFGPLRITTAIMPLHSSSGSFIYENDFVVPVATGMQPTFFLDPTDSIKQAAMQQAIESERSSFYVIPPGRVVISGDARVPVLERPYSSYLPEFSKYGEPALG